MSSLAKPYATALFEVMEKKGETSETLQILQVLVETFEKNQDVFEALKSPLISEENKMIFLSRAIGLVGTDELDNFFRLLIKNNRLPEFFGVVKTLESLNSGKQGLTKGVVDSAIELTDSEKNGVRQSLEKHLCGPVELQFRVKPEMIGGIEARVGGYLFEDSIRSHIEKLNDFVVRRI